MSILRRDDGLAFVLQPYRETLAIKNTALLRKEIRYLAEAHGNNVRLFKSATGEYEAVFSHDAGYLLGETVWSHFNRQSDLIYCEVLTTEVQQVLIVIVREGKVYLDAKLSFETLNDEVAGLLTESTSRYVIYLYGDVPVDFNQAAVKTINKLPQSLFKNLAVDEQFALLHLDQALIEHHLDVIKRKSLLVITTLCLLGLTGFWWYAKLQQPLTAQNINPYEQYELALQTPDPGQQIDALMKDMIKLESIQGWYPESFAYNGQSAQVPVRSLGGTATALLTDAQHLGMNVNFSAEGAALNFGTIVNNRATPDRISNSQQVIAVIIDRMMQVLPGKPVQINGTTANQVFSQTAITIAFNNISPAVLQLIGSNLDDLPVRLTSCTANIKNGLFTGDLQLAVVGT
jgi:hypothetical protein